MIIKPAYRTETVSEYYFATKLKEVYRMNQEGKNVLNLGIGSPDLPPHHEVIDELSQQSRIPHHHGYQSYTGIPELRKAFSEWYKSYFSVSLNPDDEILPLMGSKEGIMHISLAFLNPGDGVLIPNPGYPAYRAVANLVGARVIDYSLRVENEWFPDFNELRKMNLDGVKMMWVNYPNMPTGAKATHELFAKLVDFAWQKNILVCNDNPYSFILNKTPLSILSTESAREVAIELNSLSKSHNMAGWRVGMVGGKADYLQPVLTVKSNMDSGMFKPVQLASVKALKSSAEWYNSLDAVYEERLLKAHELFRGLGIITSKNQTGMFLWGRIPAGFATSVEFTDFLLNEFFIFITPGNIFGSNGENFVRLSLCSPVSVYEEAIQRILEKTVQKRAT